MRLVCLFYRFFTSVRCICTASHPLAPSAMSMLLAIQLYVARTLSSDPSHLENAASDAYVGSHVCYTLSTVPPRFADRLTLHRVLQNSVNRLLGIASVNAYKPLALLCFFIEVPPTRTFILQQPSHLHPTLGAPQLLAILAVTGRQVFSASP